MLHSTLAGSILYEPMMQPARHAVPEFRRSIFIHEY
jgi:hypothetical protein